VEEGVTDPEVDLQEEAGRRRATGYMLENWTIQQFMAWNRMDINEDCRKRDLEKIFSKYGPLREIWLASYAPFYAFINYESRGDMEYAAKKTDGERVAGRRIRVSIAKPRRAGPRNRY